MDDKKLANEVAAANAFLDEKIKKEKKGLTIRLVVGILVTVIIFGYMFWLNRTLTSIGTPQGVRTVIVETLRSQGSQLLGMATKELKANKTEIIKLLTEQGLDKLVDILLQEGKGKLRGMLTEITDDTVGELNGHFESVLKQEKEELAALLADPAKEGAVEELIVKAFEAHLHDSVGTETIDTTFNEPIGKKLTAAHEQLNAIHDQLKALADKETLTHRETLMIRFIKSWGAYVSDMGDAGPEPEAPVPGSSRHY